MPRLLLLTGADPVAPSQGDEWRAHGLLRGLLALGEVTVVQWGGARRGSHRYVPLGRGEWVRRAVRGLGAGPPLVLAPFRADRPAVPGRFDLVAVYPLKLAPWAFDVDARVRVLDLADSLGLLAARLKGRGTWAARVRLYGVAAAEAAWARRFDEVWVAAEADAAWLRARGVAPRVVPNGVPEIRPLGWQDPRQLLFVGNLAYPPNRLGLADFLRRVWPELARAGYRLTAVGRGTEGIRAPGVAGKGWVPDVRPYYAAAGAVVAPIRVGAGTPTKVLEALAFGRPVVAWAEGVGGLTEAQRAAVLTVAEPGEWRDALAALADRGEWERRVAAGLGAVEPWGAAQAARLTALLGIDGVRREV
ncbi:MAG: glycosyltransferase family 4 protein [Actinomycetia bacterium]|nr:glycosyltransferase family 4 protein [Actinomycetes bacterium]